MANQVRIEYDPYRQKASYQTRASTTQIFKDIPKSDLGNPENRRYHDGTLDEILKYALPELQEKRLAKELVFCGTEDDYQDFEDALASFYERKPESAWRMTLLRDETSCYRTAGSVKKEINTIFQGIVNTLTAQQSEDDQAVREKLASYTDAVSDEIPVCVVGVYSAGKSAFLNAIIGRELLPSHETETTAKITKIVRSGATRIRFAYHGTEVSLPMEADDTADETEYTPELDTLLARLSEIDGSLPEDQWVYQMMEALNALPTEAVPMITVETPFRNSSLPEDIRFVFYDTPGAATLDKPKHGEILKKELRERTNGLPVFIAELGSISRVDVVKTKDRIVERFGAALDKRNALLVISKADMPTPDALAKTSAQWRASEVSKLPELLRWQHRHVLFAAPIVALGCKLKPAELHSDEYCMNFIEKEPRFREPGRFYYSLPQYDLLPKAQMDTALAAVKAAEGDPDALALQNSGVPAVEAAMAHFARRHAGYHKCRRATEYLTDAIELTSRAIGKRQAEMLIAQKRQEDTYQEKYGALLRAIDACFQTYSIEKIAAPITNAFRTATGRAAEDFERQVKMSVLKFCLDARKEKYKTGLDGKIQEATRLLSEKFSAKCSAVLNALYGEQDAELRSALLRAIREDTVTSEEEKQLLQDIVMKAPPMPMPYSLSILKNMKAHKFLKWNWVTVNEKASAKDAAEWANETRVKIAGYAQGSYQRQYKTYCAALKERLEASQNLEKCNPELAELARQVARTERIVKYLSAKQAELRQKKDEVEALMKKQEV